MDEEVVWEGLGVNVGRGGVDEVSETVFVEGTTRSFRVVSVRTKFLKT